MRRIWVLSLAAAAFYASTHVPVSAQEALLPLESGNYWVLDSVYPDATSPGRGRIQVHAPVRVPDTERDTVIVWRERSGDSGPEYFRVAFSGRTRFFPEIQPDTLFVRKDASGNLWTRGYILDGIARLAPADKPWLMVEGAWSWDLWFDESEFAIGFARDEWIGQDPTDPDPERQVWVSSDPPYTSRLAGMADMVALALRFVPDLTPSSPQRLVSINGRLNGDLWIEHSDVGIIFVSGLGPVWCAVHTDMAEFVGVHLELAEAKVGGQIIRPGWPTAIRKGSWGEVKHVIGTRCQGDSFSHR